MTLSVFNKKINFLHYSVSFLTTQKGYFLSVLVICSTMMMEITYLVISVSKFQMNLSETVIETAYLNGYRYRQVANFPFSE